MVLSRWLLASALALLPPVFGFASTDSPSDADPAQSGYLPNHNMDPAVVDSAEFGLLWKAPFNYQEQFYAKPLTYTPNAGGNQLVFLASSQNWIRTLDAKTGDLINSRQVHQPFLQTDIPCTDIPNYIGIIGTPVIDTSSDIVYFFSKTYIPNYRYAGDTGAYNGVYYFHGVDINTLADTFPPLLVDGVVADNDPRKYFVGGTVLQRPALAKIGSVVYGGFGGHCDLFNYTGQVVGIDINSKEVVTNFVTEAGPLVPQTNVWNQNLGGGQGGIWMSGMALSTDGQRLFWVSGNGQGHENVDAPAPGSSGCRTLGEACVNLNVGDGGKLLLTDYFQPYDYQNLDGGDQDFGSGGIALLDPTVFHGTGVSKMAVTAGKNGKIYILNANNMGGYRNGPGGTDGIIQTITTNKAVFGGSGSYPLEGGYIYSTPIGYPTYVYKLGFDGNGVPLFTQAGATTETSAGRVGVGIPTITTYQGKPGTAILWMCDPDAGLRAWYAVPKSDGTMKRINLPQVNGLNKFQRPAFGDTRLYVTDAQGTLYCLGSPVNLPLNCSSPVDFGNVALGSSQTERVTCQAVIAINQVTSVTTGDANFQVNAADLPQGPLAAGATFSFPVTWNLTSTHNGNTANASYGNVSPGVKSTALTLTTLNGVGGYSTTFPISLTGTEVSQDAFLVLAPTTVDYSGLVLLNYPEDVPTNSLSFTITNAGLSPLTILGYGYTTDDLDDDDIDWTNTTFGGPTQDLGYGFTASDLPVVGTVIAGGAQISVDSTFTPVNGTGSYESYFNIWSTGGSQNIILEGSASTAPIANFSISNGEGGWLPQSNLLMDFGDVVPGTSPSLQIRICDVGGSVLEVTKSKPPNGVFRLDDPTDLHESQEIPVNQCAYGTVIFATNAETPNNPDQVYTNSWTLNTDDLNFGVHVVQIQGKVVSRKVGPTNPSGLPIYSYLGCYIDNAPAGRLLPQQPYDNSSNTNGLCQTEAQAGQYIFAGTEYQTECWSGNTPPPSTYKADETYCTFSCAGDATQVCGGFGGYLSVYYDASRYTPGNNTQPAGAPVTVSQTGNYNYIGCYSEATAGRALSGLAPLIPAGVGNTIESCEASCQGYTYFGVEYSNECYCGNTINAGSVNQPSSDILVNGCSMLCGGNGSEYCGGPDRLDMYQLNGSLPVPTAATPTPGSSPTPTPGAPSVVPSTNGFSYIGCYTDSTANRALTGLLNPVAGGVLTVELCAAACAGFSYFGVEYSAECYCGNSLLGGSAPATGGNDPTQNLCDMTCNGNNTEYCGGPNRMNTYQYNASLASASSAVSTVTGTAPFGNSSTASSTSTAAPTATGPVTVQKGVGFSYLGCYSDSVNSRALTGLANPGVASQNNVEQCASGCAGFTYFGVEYGAECYCGNTITGGSATVSGSTADVTGCNMVCSGNATEYCGGPNRINIYNYVAIVSSAASSSSTLSPTFGNLSSTAGAPPSISGTQSTTFNISNVATTSKTVASSLPSASSASIVSSVSSVAPTPTGPIHVQNVGNYAYQGCWNDTQQNSNTRTLSGSAYFNTTGMTVELCASQCAGYAWMGIEYGQECYCGTAPNVGSGIQTLTDCNVPCSGNSLEYCGGGWRLDMYQVQTTNSRFLSSVSSSNASTTSPVTSTNSSSASTTSSGFSTTGTSLTKLSSTMLSSLAPSSSNASSIASSNSIVSSSKVILASSILSSTTPSSSGASATSTVVSSSSTASSSNVTSSSSSSSSTRSSTLSSSASSSSNSSSSTILSSTKSSSSPLSSSAPSSVRSSSQTSSSTLSSSLVSSSQLLSTTFSSSLISSSKVSSTTLSSSIISSSRISSNTPSSTSLSSSSVSSSKPPSTTPSSTTLSSTAPSSTAPSSTAPSSTTPSSTTPSSTTPSSTTPSTLSSSVSAPSTSASTISSIKTSAVSSTQSSKISTTPSSTAPSVHTPTVGELSSTGWSYLGCANDSVTPRALSGASYTNTSGMTIESCQSYCSTHGNNFNLAGLEYGQECYCGSGLQNHAAVGQPGCSQPCAGNASEICGNANLLSLYNLTTYQPPTTVQQVGYYVSQGCYNEVPNGRILGGPSYTNASGMTVESCVQFCQAASPSMKFAGVEYAQECYCGSTLPGTATTAGAGSCNMLCTGNSKEYCGGSGVLNVYAYNATSVSANGVPATGSQS